MDQPHQRHARREGRPAPCPLDEQVLDRALVDRVVELPEEFQHVSGSPVLRDQGQTLPVRSLAREWRRDQITMKMYGGAASRRLITLLS